MPCAYYRCGRRICGVGPTAHRDPGRFRRREDQLRVAGFFWLSESGVRCSALDPKIDFANFVYYLSFGPQVLHPGFMDAADAGALGVPGSPFQPMNDRFWRETEIVDLARGARGSQDPWRITRTFNDGYNPALNITDVVFTEDIHRRIVRIPATRSAQDDATGKPPGSHGSSRI